MGFLSKVFGGGGGGSQTSSTSVWGTQAPYLSGLYKSALNAYGPAQQQLQAMTFGQGGLMSQGQGMVGQLGMLGQIGNPFAQQQIADLGSQLGNFFQTQLNPTIRSDYAGLGQLGGSRQAVAQGLAAGQLGQQFTSGALGILGNSADLALQANQAGLQGLGGLQNLSLGGNFGALQALAGLYGNPVMTQYSQGTQKGTSNGIFAPLSFGFMGGPG